MPTRFLRVLIATVLAAGPHSAQAGPTGSARPAPRTIAELEAGIRRILDSTHTPGVSLTMVSRDSILYAGGLGLANVAEKRAAIVAGYLIFWRFIGWRTWA